ncbi:unnamed protein product [Leptidea sinapis]|uniref:Uncharacterized protein n=1 Tax=Leptidea sinapis TaxID=189913 RepID=A0A5E4PM69_9NEOP|nr:unnamed protein product [Leptidea sinapis]
MHDNLEMKSRRKILMFHGVPEAKEENVTRELIKIIKDHLQFDISKDDIRRCHRMGRVDEKPRPIIIKFQNLERKDQVWTKKSGFKGTFITISKFLTRRRREVFLVARKCFGISKCWTTHDLIIVIGPDGSQHHVECTKDVEAIYTAKDIVGPSSHGSSNANTKKAISIEPSVTQIQVISGNSPVVSISGNSGSMKLGIWVF